MPSDKVNCTRTQSTHEFRPSLGATTEEYHRLRTVSSLAVKSTLFLERIDTAVKFKHPAWSNDMINVIISDHENREPPEVLKTMTKLENANLNVDWFNRIAKASGKNEIGGSKRFGRNRTMERKDEIGLNQGKKECKD